MTATEGDQLGFFNRLRAPEQCWPEAQALAAEIADGPTFANGITKTCLQSGGTWRRHAAVDLADRGGSPGGRRSACRRSDYGCADRAFCRCQ